MWVWMKDNLVLLISPQYAQQWNQYYQNQGQWPPYYGNYDYGSYTGNTQGGTSTQ